MSPRQKMLTAIVFAVGLAVAIVCTALILRSKPVDPKAACLQRGGVWQAEGQTNVWATVQDSDEPRCWYTLP